MLLFTTRVNCSRHFFIFSVPLHRVATPKIRSISHWPYGRLFTRNSYSFEWSVYMVVVCPSETFFWFLSFSFVSYFRFLFSTFWSVSIVWRLLLYPKLVFNLCTFFRRIWNEKMSKFRRIKDNVRSSSPTSSNEHHYNRNSSRARKVAQTKVKSATLCCQNKQQIEFRIGLKLNLSIVADRHK